MPKKASPQTLARWDQQYIWHPFTQQSEWQSRHPIIIESAKGVWLKDQQGRRLLDGVSSLWVNVWGHHHPGLDRALSRQLKRIAHSTFLGLTHEPAIRLAKELIRLVPPPLSRVFYSDNGSTSVEVALKMAYQYWQLRGEKKKTKFVSLKDGYHGDTIGAVSVGGVQMFHDRFGGLLFDGYKVRPPHPTLSPRRGKGVDSHVTSPSGEVGCSPGEGPAVPDIEQILKTQHAHIAAVVMEPLIQGASGMRLMPTGYLAHVSRLCRKYNVLLIVDEVATGFGRTGTMFAVEQENVVPDFLCLAKSLTAGYLPLAATITTEKIFKQFLGRFDEFKTFFHGHTYTANPLACAVALENLRLYKEKNLLANVRARSAQMKNGLRELSNNAHVKEIRQLGLMCGIELQSADGKPYPPARRAGLRVCDAAIRRGLWLRPLGDVVVLMPPLAISEKDMAFLLRTVKAAINEVTTSENGG